MVKNRHVKIRMTKNQLERVRMNAQAKGFVSVARYMRYVALEHSQHIEGKILENNRILNEFIVCLKENKL